MNCTHTPDFAPDVMTKLRKAASAEEFFELLGLAYDPKVLNVARLHILKRMGEYLEGEDIDGVPDRVAAARCRSVLERAYEEFVTTSPLEARVFKVLKTGGRAAQAAGVRAVRHAAEIDASKAYSTAIPALTGKPRLLPALSMVLSRLKIILAYASPQSPGAGHHRRAGRRRSAAGRSLRD